MLAVHRTDRAAAPGMGAVWTARRRTALPQEGRRSGSPCARPQDVTKPRGRMILIAYDTNRARCRDSPDSVLSIFLAHALRSAAEAQMQPEKTRSVRSCAGESRRMRP